MILLQLSSAQGPEECCLAVKKALDRLIKEAARQDVATLFAFKKKSGHRVNTPP